MKNQDLALIRDSLNLSEAEMLSIGYCVMSFERVTFLITGLLEDDHEKRIVLLDRVAGCIAKEVGKKFGNESKLYKDYYRLVKDRNSIIHAFGFPNLEEEKWDRYYLKKGYIEDRVNEEFMVEFTRRCFQLFPILDYKKVLQQYCKESNS